MLALRSAVVSSALLFILGAGCLHPASGMPPSPGAAVEESTPSVLIAEFYPCAVNGDEYLALSNGGAEAVNLLDWAVTDGEGAIRFSAVLLMPSSSLYVSENATSFSSAFGESPGIEVTGWSAGEGVVVTGRFRLADSGDVLELIAPDGKVADAVAYGDVSPPASGWSGAPVPGLRQGEVARRLSLEHAGDTDTAVDWTHFREFRYGYSDHGAMSSSVAPGGVTCFASPDCSLDSVLSVLSGADETIRLCAYEMSSPAVCASLSEARSRGVLVRVLVDSLPVGGMSASEVACLSFLTRSGVAVNVIGGSLDNGVVRHVGAMHAKYVVVDDAVLLATSENFVEDGVPTDRLFGNRGWGVSIRDGCVASYMASVFDDDSRTGRSDVWPWSKDPRYDPSAALPEAPVSQHLVGMMQPTVSESGVEVAVFVSPDASPEAPFIVPIIEAADELVFEQFQADLMWEDRWSAELGLSHVLDAVAEVASRGGRVRGLFDGTWYNVNGNSEAVEFLSASALATGAESSFGLLANNSPVTVLHNKGMVLDSVSVVSSNNWVRSSFARNRELAVVMRSEDVSSYFLQAFALDWVPDTQAPVADAGTDVVTDSPGEINLDASGSWDDRAVASYSWDFDRDGRADASGVRAEFFAERPGTYRVLLEVKDAWGNAATDSVTLTVGPVWAPSEGPAVAVSRLPWVLPAVASAVFVALAVVRKVNLLRSSTRGKG